LEELLRGRAQNEWEDASGNTHNLADLEEILRKHREWSDSNGKSGTRAYLDGAHILFAHLPGANLSGAYLRGAYLVGADLIDANLSANLSGAELTDAYLIGAFLWGADLNNATLELAKLMAARLNDADLRTANLDNAYLDDADLTGADLTGANFHGADVAGAHFEPKSLPELRGIAAARNLELLTYFDNPDSLVQLRKQFEDGGFRDQERKITYALKRREAELSWGRCTGRTFGSWDYPSRKRAMIWSSDSTLANCGSFVLNKGFFDWTCQYGMSPGRPLIVGLFLWFVCSLVYFACIHTGGQAGLYRIYGKNIHKDVSAQPRVERISPPRRRRRVGLRWLLQFFWRECLLLRTSMFFSLMSAFNIGFRDINFGRWLRLLTRQEFDIKAVGWARVIAGWQSLISVYLIALWILTYFGRPFE
jgi:uncharacterized protein YjbI with pentapeptide repeats